MIARMIIPFQRFFASLGPVRRQQVAALCWRQSEGAVEFLLITTRRTGRWTPPKGNVDEGATPPEAAATEAWEEAGATGDIAAEPIGCYTFLKLTKKGRWAKYQAAVYPLHVRDMADAYPELGQRELCWKPQEEAADAVNEPALSALIRAFQPGR